MTQYVKKTFEHAWQAARFVQEGGKLYDNKEMLLCEADAYDLAEDGIVFKVEKQTDWREQLDGTVENGVLCWCSNEPRRGRKSLSLVIGYDNETRTNLVYDTELDSWPYATPLTKSEIDKFKGNAPV